MEDVSVFALLARLVVSLGVVLGLMWVAARLLARGNGGRGPRTVRPVPIQIVARQSLSKNSSVAVVQTAGKALIVGITDSQVTLLGEGDLEALAEPETEDPVAPITAAARTRSPWATTRQPGAAAFTSPWTAMLETLRDRTARKS